MTDDILPWVAIGVAANAEAEASDAREAAERAEAIARVRGFVNDTATVEERQQYAEAVRVLYPIHRHHEPMTRGQRVAVGVAILVWIVAVVCGAVYGARNPGRWRSPLEAAIDFGGLTAVLVPIACFFSVLAVVVVCLPFWLIFGG